jgi:putative intracellular protease/amidase
VCHAPAVFRHAKSIDGQPLVSGRQVTGFANSEEDAAQLSRIVPFLVEDMLVANGGMYSKGPDWKPHVMIDGSLVTGQNPASSAAAAQAVLARLTGR